MSRNEAPSRGNSLSGTAAAGYHRRIDPPARGGPTVLRILGSRKRLCDGLTRRDLLRAGGLALFGLTLPELFALREAQASPAAPTGSFGQAKRCILLYLYGAPSQLETFDLKPDAPAALRIQVHPIPTRVPAVQICDHPPRTPQDMDRRTLERSKTHPTNIPSAAYSLPDTPPTDTPRELNPRDARH